jgi:hypothetical protein
MQRSPAYEPRSRTSYLILCRNVIIFRAGSTGTRCSRYFIARSAPGGFPFSERPKPPVKRGLFSPVNARERIPGRSSPIVVTEMTERPTVLVVDDSAFIKSKLMRRWSSRADRSA